MKSFRNILLVALASFTVLSCNKDMFDEAEYQKIVEIAQPVTGIDKSHTWELSSTYYMTATLGAFQGAKKLLILSGNPAVGEGATILGNYLLNGESRQYIAFSAPSVQSTFYAAVVDADSKYTITSFDPSSRTIDFSSPLAKEVTIKESLLGRQSYSFCFEDEMPEPGDYDYNDVVLRISQERTAANQVTLDVTLAAVGSLSQVAAAMRLVDYKYDDIESVTTLEDENFNKGYRRSTLSYIDSEELLIRGLNGEAVINLFEDAHWATGSAYYASEGYIPRYKYNVTKSTSEQADMVSPRTVSYVITFKKSANLNYFTLGLLDPFTITQYNGAYMENHAIYKYKLLSVLHEYTQPDNTAVLPWALAVPSGSFRYPLDRVNIGFSKNGALFGAFMTSGHAFGEWATNKDKATDWYNYPTSNQVY